MQNEWGAGGGGGDVSLSPNRLARVVKLANMAGSYHSVMCREGRAQAHVY